MWYQRLSRRRVFTLHFLASPIATVAGTLLFFSFAVPPAVSIWASVVLGLALSIVYFTTGPRIRRKPWGWSALLGSAGGGRRVVSSPSASGDLRPRHTESRQHPHVVFLDWKRTGPSVGTSTALEECPGATLTSVVCSSTANDRPRVLVSFALPPPQDTPQEAAPSKTASTRGGATEAVVQIVRRLWRWLWRRPAQLLDHATAFSHPMFDKCTIFVPWLRRWTLPSGRLVLNVLGGIVPYSRNALLALAQRQASTSLTSRAASLIVIRDSTKDVTVGSPICQEGAGKLGAVVITASSSPLLGGTEPRRVAIRIHLHEKGVFSAALKAESSLHPVVCWGPGGGPPYTIFVGPEVDARRPVLLTTTIGGPSQSTPSHANVPGCPSADEVLDLVRRFAAALEATANYGKAVDDPPVEVLVQ